MTAFLTGASTEESRTDSRPELGLLVSPDNSVHRQAHHYGLVGADNGQYVASKKGVEFGPARAAFWLRWLRDVSADTELVFASLPDVLEWHWIETPKGAVQIPVGNLEATFELSAKYLDAVLELGVTPALVAQDGLMSVTEFPRWRELGGVFVGGSDDYKLGAEAAGVVAEANELGLWTHVGRVNSAKRFRYCRELAADSCDGTFLRYRDKARPPSTWRRLSSWLDEQASEFPVAA